MIKHYLNIAWRNLLKQKALTGINIFGLSIGIGCFTLLLLYAVNEFNYDRFHKNKADIYKVYRWRPASNGEPGGGETYVAMPLGPAIKQDIPAVKEFVRFREGWGKEIVRIDDKTTIIPGLSYTDASFFSVFSFLLKSGNPAQVLSAQNSIVITETMAKKLFSLENPVGKTMEIKLENKFVPFVVSGVCEDMPSNSSIHFDVIGNMAFFNSGRNKEYENSWRRSGYFTYVQLQPGSKLAAEKKELLSFFKKYNPSDKPVADELSPTYGLLPIESVHTATTIEDSAIETKNIWILIAIATGIVLISCINFTTLAIGRSASRAKEIGVRKVIGGTRKSLIIQFLTESVLLSIVSTLIGIFLAWLALPAFNALTDSTILFSFRQFPELIWMLAGLSLFVGLLAGSYPALVLAGFKPIEVLKKKLKLNGSNIFTRSLVTIQFTISAGLIITTVVILQQLTFMRGHNPGYNKENIVAVQGDYNDTTGIYSLFRQELLNNPRIKAIAATDIAFGEGSGWSRTGFEHKGEHKSIYEYTIDQHYLDLMGIPLLAGRNFDAATAADTSNGIVINEAMMKNFGWRLENAVGQVVTGYNEEKPSENPVVIGVARDFNYKSLYENIEPQMFRQLKKRDAPDKYYVRINAGDPATALTAIQTSWKSVVPDVPLQYSFLDEDLDRFYKREERWGKIVGSAGGICIFLACLGLFGLAALASINRTKEIGIRKILGATGFSIIKLISKEFMLLIIIAVMIATPLTWYFMNQWLQDFPYRVSLSWWVFLTTGIFALLIAFVTIALQTAKTAAGSPVKNMRAE